MPGAVGDQTLVPLLRDEMVAWETLEDRYGALLKLVEVLLGVVPNCDRYLEIWPPAFRTYNVMVPNFLNLPAPIFGVGGAPGEMVGLGMYVSSRVAECAYCTAHSCSFALRRGASADTVAQALIGGDANLTRDELATIAVARSLGRIPCELTAAERDELVDVFGPARALAADVHALAGAHDVDPDQASADPRLPAALMLARAASPSPAQIDADVVAACRDSGLPPAAIVELVTWLAVLQMLHRLSCFHSEDVVAG